MKIPNPFESLTKGDFFGNLKFSLVWFGATLASVASLLTIMPPGFESGHGSAPEVALRLCLYGLSNVVIYKVGARVLG